MRTPTRVLLAVGAATLVAGGGSAFTASNTNNETQNFLGYNAVTVTGVTVTNIAYVHDAGDISLLDRVTFSVSQDISAAGYEAKLTVNGATNTPTVCDRSVAGTVSCDITPNPAVAGVTSIQFNVSPV